MFYCIKQTNKKKVKPDEEAMGSWSLAAQILNVSLCNLLQNH